MTLQNQQVAEPGVPRMNVSVPSSDPCSERLLSVKQAAEYLNMSAKWVYRNYKSLPHVPIGGGEKPRIKFRRCDLDAWVKRHRIQ